MREGKQKPITMLGFSVSSLFTISRFSHVIYI